MFQPGSDFGICRKSYWVTGARGGAGGLCAYKCATSVYVLLYMGPASFSVWAVGHICTSACLRKHQNPMACVCLICSGSCRLVCLFTCSKVFGHACVLGGGECVEL